MATVARDAIRIEGLKEFLARMKAAEQAVPNKVMRTAFNSAASLVAEDARRRAPVRTGALQSSIVASSTATYARVSGGSSSVPYFGFIDYGNRVHGGRGKVGRRDSNPRPFIRTGRILYPAFRAQRESVITMTSTALRNGLKSVGLVVDE
jgi:HK97 gp10 family phage protein